MATRDVGADSSDEDGFHSLSLPGEDDDVASTCSDNVLMAPPSHPCPQLQAAFEESIRESTEYLDEPDVDTAIDAEMRRRRLLETDRDDDDAAIVRWKQRPGAKHHPFVKLVAQLAFGMHLLQERQAKSDEEVVKILQNHVNEVDGFLERTAEDFDLAIKDIEERIRHLKLPMHHMDIFEVMLDEKKFRTDLINGNEKIERIISRTAKSMNAAMHDIHNGIKSTKELSTYLDGIEKQWPMDDRNIAEVFAAMRGNEQGWMSYLRDLRTKGDNLRNNLVVLEGVIGAISRHAAAASRRNKTQGRQVSGGSYPTAKSSPLRSKFTRDTPSQHYKKPGAWLDKPLPKEPGAVPAVKQAIMAQPHPVALATRFEQPRSAIPTPHKSTAHRSPDRTRISSRASVAREPTINQQSTQEHSHFFRSSDPLRSHPPDGSSSKRTPARSQSQGWAAPPIVPDKPFRRSHSQNALAAFSDSHPAPRFNRQQIPRKPVGSGTRENVAAPAVLHSSQPFQTRDGFSRRISKRLKSIPAPLLSTNHTQSSAPAPRKEVARPIDSAQSHSRDRDPGDSNYRKVDVRAEEQDVTSDIEKQLSVDAKKEAPRSESRVGHRLFPTVDKPLTPLQAGHHARASYAKETLHSDHSSPQTLHTHSSKASRTGSIRKFFHHRRGESRHLLVS